MRVTPLAFVLFLAIPMLCHGQQPSPSPPTGPVAAKPESVKAEATTPEAARTAQEQREKAEQARRATLKKELKDYTYFDLRERLRTIDTELSTLQITRDKTATEVDGWQDVTEQRLRDLEPLLEKLPPDTEQYRAIKQEIADVNRWLKEKPEKEPLAKSKLVELDARLHDIQLMRDEINEEMVRRIDLEGPQHDFKKAMSIAFAVLVGFVIAGFFWIASRDKEVRRDVFSGQAGLQFITLFSLVIAIILFGVIGVLEGKELAALLGGLSGYILGRTTAQREGSDRQAPPAGNRESTQKTAKETLKPAA
jgi:hypothetical protein